MSTIDTVPGFDGGPVGGDRFSGGDPGVLSTNNFRNEFISELEVSGMGAFRGFTQDVVNLDWGPGRGDSDAREAHFYNNIWPEMSGQETGGKYDFAAKAREAEALALVNNDRGNGVSQEVRQLTDQRFFNPPKRQQVA